jgi:hypothetical protein
MKGPEQLYRPANENEPDKARVTPEELRDLERFDVLATKLQELLKNEKPEKVMYLKHKFEAFELIKKWTVPADPNDLRFRALERFNLILRDGKQKGLE